MKFFKKLNTDDFKEFMTILITISVFIYVLLPTSFTDAGIRGAMLTLLGIIIRHYFENNNDEKNGLV